MRCKHYEQIRNFNPRSHERSDQTRAKDQERKLLISIHAPTRGATATNTCKAKYRVISIHAPTRGATALIRAFTAIFQHFNPRSHERSDQATNLNSTHKEISIHAPTRGATEAFNKIDSSNAEFQSTLPREERPINGVISGFYRYFNPRSHERSDRVISVRCSVLKKFQSTLPREERR